MALQDSKVLHIKEDFINPVVFIRLGKSLLRLKRGLMKFIVKDMDIATGGTLVAILNKNDARHLDLHSGDRILVRNNSREVPCILDISESKKAVPEGKIGLFEEVLAKLQVSDGSIVDIKLTGKPESVKHIRDKLYGKKLPYQELYHIMDDITHDRLTDIEKTYFVAGGFTRGFTHQEIVDMTKAMVYTGKRLKFPGITVDKHSIGGIPGNRTTMIIVPILAAAGFTMPKTSSRAITSPAGTADTMECLANVELTERQIQRVVRKTGACMVHGGSMSLAPADDRIIDVEHPLSIDAEGQLLASVMAKKYSVSAKHVLIDIPMGKSTKAPTRKKAEHLREMFELIGRKLGMNVRVIITDGAQPIGYGVGPLLEARDVLAVLRNDSSAPADLKKKGLMMAGKLLGMAGKYKDGLTAATEILESGQAWQKMNEIIEAQGRKRLPPLGTYSWAVRATKTGTVKEIGNESIAKIARLAGAPDDKGAGLYIQKKVSDRVRAGEVLYTIYAESKFKLELAKEFTRQDKGYEVG